MKRVLSALEGEDLNTGDPVPLYKLESVVSKHIDLIRNRTIEFSLYEDRLPVEQLLHDLHCMEKEGCKIAMIDNLNFFLEVTRSADQLIEMDRVIRELIIFCKKVDMHVIMVMHPRKTDGGRVESEFDIKGSSTAVQEAHNVFLFNRPKNEFVTAGTRDSRDRELKIAKMRRRGQYVGHEIVYEYSGTRYDEKGVQ